MILEQIKQHLESIPGIKFVYVFGSFGTPHYVEGKSDIDIAIFGDHIYRFDELTDMADEIQRKIPGHPEIDLVDLSQDAIILNNQVIQHGKLIFCNDKVTHDNFLITQWSKYIDFKEYMKRFDKDLKERILK